MIIKKGQRIPQDETQGMQALQFKIIAEEPRKDGMHYEYNIKELAEFTKTKIQTKTDPDGKTYFEIPTSEGKTRVNVGDWILKDSTGNLSTCKPDVFKNEYFEI